VKEARQAIGYAIDYDGIVKSMLGGAALRPAHYLPIGVSGSTEEIARQIGFRQDLAKAKELLAKAGFPNGFEFEIIYGNAAVQGVTYQDLGLKIQSDVARVGIKANSAPGRSGEPAHRIHHRKAKGGVLTFWESARGGEPALGRRRGAARRQARALGSAGEHREARLAGGDRDRSEEAARPVGSSGRSSWSIRPTTSCCSRAGLPDRRAQHDQGFPAHPPAGWMLVLHGVTPAAGKAGRAGGESRHCGARTRAFRRGETCRVTSCPGRACVVMALLATLVIFLLANTVPGDPVLAQLGDLAASNKEFVAEWRAKWGLDLPLWQRYVIFLQRLLHGDLGISISSQRPVLQDIRDFAPGDARACQHRVPAGADRRHSARHHGGGAAR
jgi:hypothetical protein